MKSWLTVFLASSFLFGQPCSVTGETVRLRSGREVEMVEGKVSEKVAKEIYHEAYDLLRKGRLDLANDNWKLVIQRGVGPVVLQAKAAQEKSRRIEYGSFVVLRNGQVLKGKVQAHLRADLLGLEGKRKIPLWQVEEIVAEYHAGFSQVSKTFYPLTILEISLRDRGIQTSRITGEIEFSVEGENGLVTKAVLGKAFELLRDKDLGKQIETRTKDLIIKVVIYPELRNLK